MKAQRQTPKNSAKVKASALHKSTRGPIKEKAVSEANVREFLESRASSKEVLISKAAGESLSAGAVARLLQMATGDVHKAKDQGRILAYQEPGKQTYRFPSFQFEGSVVAPWIPELIETVGNGFSAVHFLTVRRKSLKNQNHLSRIRVANTAERLKALAEMGRAARKLLPSSQKARSVTSAREPHG